MATAAQLFKQSLFAVLQEHVEQQKPFTISWHCVYCGDPHAGNLFKKARSVSDVVGEPNQMILADENGQTFVVVIISKNKKPNLGIAHSFRDQGIIYLQICPPVGDEKNIVESVSNPRFVSTCLNPKCKTCGGYQSEKSLVIIDSECWKCNSKMKVAIMDCNGHYTGPEAFTGDELTFARSKGVLIKNNFSKTVGESYLSNTCPTCAALTGQHYLFTDHYTEAMNGYYTYESYPAGYSCEYCYMGYGEDIEAD
jgi:hypothetical protein